MLLSSHSSNSSARSPHPASNSNGGRTILDSQSTRAKGASAEDTVVDYLEKKGYAILSRNFQIHLGEIDCIARDQDNTLVFVEVKSTRSTSFGHPFFWVDRGKQRTLTRVAQFYMTQNRIHGCSCRFDVIAIVNGKIEHLRNAFLV
jgi:putative endonuclease